MTEPTDERLLELAEKATQDAWELLLAPVNEHGRKPNRYITSRHRAVCLVHRLDEYEELPHDSEGEANWHFIAACSPAVIRALVEGKRRAEESLRVELNELLKRNEGRTHYPGCEKEHPMCAAIGRIRAALPQPERGGGA
jgi:hypothetical protein